MDGLESHNRGESPQTRSTEEHDRSFGAYGRSAVSVSIPQGPLAPRMTPPEL
jgi:hypothetical protein